MLDAVDAAISDLDGTLVDTRAANAAAYRAAFESIKAPFDGAAYEAAFGLRFREMVSKVSPGRSEDDVAAIRRAKAAFYPSFFGLLSVNSALVALLETLRGKGVRLGLASTASGPNLQAVLGHTGLSGLFSAVISGDDVTRGKPAPDCYSLAAARLGVLPERCIAFEDSSVGVAAARAAGCRVLEIKL